jgi:hypothetical protein
MIADDVYQFLLRILTPTGLASTPTGVVEDLHADAEAVAIVEAGRGPWNREASSWLAGEPEGELQAPAGWSPEHPHHSKAFVTLARVPEGKAASLEADTPPPAPGYVRLYSARAYSQKLEGKETNGAIDVAVADVGSVPRQQFGWSAFVGGEWREGHDIGALADVVAGRLGRDGKVALGFEAPLFAPLPDDSQALGQKREGEPLAWSAGAGPGVLATGLVQVTWLLHRVRCQAQDCPAFLDWDTFAVSRTGLFLWEACVTGSAKAGSHIGDARVAVDAFRKALPDPTTSSIVKSGRVLSLIGAALLTSRWSSNLDLLEAPCLVIAPRLK